MTQNPYESLLLNYLSFAKRNHLKVFWPALGFANSTQLVMFPTNLFVLVLLLQTLLRFPHLLRFSSFFFSLSLFSTFSPSIYNLLPPSLFFSHLALFLSLSKHQPLMG